MAEPDPSVLGERLGHGLDRAADEEATLAAARPMLGEVGLPDPRGRSRKKKG